MHFPSLSPKLLNRGLVIDFFWKFSVFECALKNTERLTQDRSNNAKADWDKFGANIQLTDDLESAARRLIKLAPKKQIVRECGGDKSLGWKEPSKREGDTEIQYAISLLRTVRNNLFHGGKYADESFDRARDRAILQSALEVLDACYSADLPIQNQIDSSISQLAA